MLHIGLWFKKKRKKNETQKLQSRTFCTDVCKCKAFTSKCLTEFNYKFIFSKKKQQQLLTV